MAGLEESGENSPEPDSSGMIDNIYLRKTKKRDSKRYITTANRNSRK